MSCNQMAATTNQWWRRLVKAYKVKAGMVCLQRKKLCDPYFKRWVSYNEVLYKSLYLYIFTSLPSKLQDRGR